MTLKVTFFADEIYVHNVYKTEMYACVKHWNCAFYFAANPVKMIIFASSATSQLSLSRLGDRLQTETICSQSSLLEKSLRMNEIFFIKPRVERKKQRNEFPHFQVTSALNRNTHGFDPRQFLDKNKLKLNSFNSSFS